MTPLNVLVNHTMWRAEQNVTEGELCVLWEWRTTRRLISVPALSGTHLGLDAEASDLSSSEAAVNRSISSTAGWSSRRNGCAEGWRSAVPTIVLQLLPSSTFYCRVARSSFLLFLPLLSAFRSLSRPLPSFVSPCFAGIRVSPPKCRTWYEVRVP